MAQGLRGEEGETSFLHPYSQIGKFQKKLFLNFFNFSLVFGTTWLLIGSLRDSDVYIYNATKY